MNAKFLFFSLKGRISRKWWWIGMLSVLIVSLGLSIFSLWLLGEDPTFYWNDQLPTPKHALIDVVIFLITFRAAFAVDIKRIHDRGRTAYLLVPLYLGELALIAMDGTQTNPFYFDIETNSIISIPVIILALILLFLVYAIWLFIELGLGRGNKGASKYGPDPSALLTQTQDETL